MGRKLVLVSVMVIILTIVLSAASSAQKVQAVEITGDKALASTTLQSDMPVVHVDPQSITADPGDTFTIYVKIFNLSNNFHVTDEQWEYGEPLGPPGVRHNYSLGGLFGVDLQLQWDPTVLDYVEHTVTMPVETYPEGLLHATPELEELKDEVDAEAGTYWLAKSSQTPADAFDRPDENSTAFSMTFTVLKRGISELTITNSDLGIPLAYPEYIEANVEIPHWRISGLFQTPALATRIDKLEVGAPVGEQIEDPVISGEDAEIRVLVKNDNFTLPDTHNITIYRGATALDAWNNVVLQPTGNATYTITLDKDGLSVGSETITVNVTSTLLESNDTFETASKTLRVIDVPDLSILGPSLVAPDEKATFTSYSTHTDPGGELLILRWALWRQGDHFPRLEGNGTVVEFEIYLGWLGNFTVTLDVLDNYGVIYDPARPATDPWRKTKNLRVDTYTCSEIEYDLRLQMFSGSMHPTLEVLDFVYVKNVSGSAEVYASYGDGDIILFHRPGYPGSLIIHRAVDTFQMDSTYFITKGDHNAGVDPWNVPEDNVIGKIVAFSRKETVNSFNVTIFSNSAFSNFYLNHTTNELEVDINALLTRCAPFSFLNITIPNELVSGELDVLVYASSLPFEHSTNSTHHFVWFSLPGSGYIVHIVIPEYSSLIILPLFMLGTLLAAIFYRRKKSKAQLVENKEGNYGESW